MVLIIIIIPAFLFFKNLTDGFFINGRHAYIFPERPDNFVTVVNLVRPRYLWIDQETETLKLRRFDGGLTDAYIKKSEINKRTKKQWKEFENLFYKIPEEALIN